MSDTETTYQMTRIGKIIKPEFNKDEFTVVMDKENTLFSCSCKKMLRDGIHCCHVLRVVVHLGLVTSMPDTFVNPRWKRCNPHQPSNYVFRLPEGNHANAAGPIRYVIQLTRFAKICSKACTSDKSYQTLLNCMDYTEKMVNACIDQNEQPAIVNSGVTLDDSDNIDGSNLGALRDPPIIKRKGRKKGQRQKPGSEKKKRRCGKCKKLGHTKPTCTVWLLEREVILNLWFNLT